MITDNDYDEDGNNIVPCPICLSEHCPSKEGGKCPEEDEFAKAHESEQKEEKATPSTKILTGLQFHRNDCPVRFVNCICNFNADEVLDEVKKMVKEEPRTPKA